MLLLGKYVRGTLQMIPWCLQLLHATTLTMKWGDITYLLKLPFYCPIADSIQCYSFVFYIRYPHYCKIVFLPLQLFMLLFLQLTFITLKSRRPKVEKKKSSKEANKQTSKKDQTKHFSTRLVNTQCCKWIFEHFNTYFYWPKPQILD